MRGYLADDIHILTGVPLDFHRLVRAVKCSATAAMGWVHEWKTDQESETCAPPYYAWRKIHDRCLRALRAMEKEVKS
jgi:hypothetical protein